MGVARALLGIGSRQAPAAEKYPGFNRRMLAVTIDSLILLVFLPLINALAPIDYSVMNNYSINPNDPGAGRHFAMHLLSNPAFVHSWSANFMLQMVVWCVYSAIFLKFWSATPGKMLLRMKVVDSKTEGRITTLQAVLRSFGYFPSTLLFCLGFIWIGIDRRKRGWHDYLADTMVINLPLMPWKKGKAQTPPEAPEEQEHAPAVPMPDLDKSKDTV